MLNNFAAEPLAMKSTIAASEAKAIAVSDVIRDAVGYAEMIEAAIPRLQAAANNLRIAAELATSSDPADIQRAIDLYNTGDNFVTGLSYGGVIA